MALPKKGTRKIVIDNDIYRYRVRSNGGDNSCVLTVERPDGKIVRKVVNTNAMIPSEVADNIRNWDK